MALTLQPLVIHAGINPQSALVIRHAFVRMHEDTGIRGIHVDSTEREILEYTSEQSADTKKFPANPAKYWIVFIKEGGDRARLWRVVENRGEISNDGAKRVFDLVVSDQMTDLHNRLVIGWRSPRTWWMHAVTAGVYPVVEIADAEPIPFPGFDQLILEYPQLQSVMRENRYASWRTALSSVIGIYLITDTRDGRQYVGKADGAENLRQRWSIYATNGHGGNVELRNLDASSFRFSVLRVFDPATPNHLINQAESHYKEALGTRQFGLNRN